MGQASTKVPLNTKKRRGNFVLTKGHFGHQVAKGQVLEHPTPPPSARACISAWWQHTERWAEPRIKICKSL